jgi:hypothetical protein
MLKGQVVLQSNKSALCAGWICSLVAQKGLVVLLIAKTVVLNGCGGGGT